MGVAEFATELKEFCKPPSQNLVCCQTFLESSLELSFGTPDQQHV
jgi:hypothetical protein